MLHSKFFITIFGKKKTIFASPVLIVEKRYFPPASKNFPTVV